MLVRRRLNSRDQALQQRLNRPLGELPGEELTLENIRALEQAIQQAQTPQQRAVLLQEAQRLREMAATLQGPLPRPDYRRPGELRNDFMLLPYNPATQAPGVYGGQRLAPPAPSAPWQYINPQQMPNPRPAAPFPPPGGIRG